MGLCAGHGGGTQKCAFSLSPAGHQSRRRPVFYGPRVHDAATTAEDSACNLAIDTLSTRCAAQQAIFKSAFATAPVTVIILPGGNVPWVVGRTDYV